MIRIDDIITHRSVRSPALVRLFIGAVFGVMKANLSAFLNCFVQQLDVIKQLPVICLFNRRLYNIANARIKIDV